ncbi:MAG: type II toxin-antitoxin system VapC family toxin [Actinomycetota bacterium]|nr:type II toxin-antitoxin system VapC family toxin [Actinomycetota bacterium]
MRIAYVDSSVIVRRYLPGDAGHRDAAELFAEIDTATVSSTLARIEVSGALVRAARHAGIDPSVLLARFEQDIAGGDPLIVSPDQAAVESSALDLVRRHAIRALDALHVAAAVIVLAELVGPGDVAVFVSRDNAQAAAARASGLATG